VAGTHPPSPDPGDALAAEFRRRVAAEFRRRVDDVRAAGRRRAGGGSTTCGRRVDDVRAARPQMPLDRVDATALRDVALAHPEATAHALRETLLDGSVALDAGTIADADRYADATVARTLLDPEVRQARVAHQRD